MTKIPFRRILLCHRPNPSPAAAAVSAARVLPRPPHPAILPFSPPAPHHRDSRRRRHHATRGIAGGGGAPPPDEDATKTSATATTHRHSHRATLRGVHPEHLYRVINDVDEYRNFLPHCRESRVLRTSECGTMYDAILGVGILPTMTIPGLPSLEERYVSRVRTRSPAAADDDDDIDADDAAAMGGRTRPTAWTVEAKSIRSTSFDSLRSRWVLTFAGEEEDDDDGDQNPEGSESAYSSGTIDDDNRRRDDDDSVACSCGVDFEVEIRVSDPLVSFVLDGVLGGVARRQVEAFERRCNEVQKAARRGSGSIIEGRRRRSK